MLRDIISFIAARTGLKDREAILREINYAWNEIWNSDDLPNSLFEVTVVPSDSADKRISLPYFVHRIRAVKESGSRLRVTVNTPRPYYQDGSYDLSPYTWRELGSSPLSRTIENASLLKFSITTPETARFTVTVIGPDDNAVETRDQVIFSPGDLEKWTTKRFTDATSIVKDALLSSNVSITGANDEDFGIIPNLAYEARNTVIQVTDKCACVCTSCNCFDILFKKPAPVLYYDEQAVPFPEVLMTKTLEWIELPKDGQEKKALIYAEKSKALLNSYNANERGVEKKIDLGTNHFCTARGDL